MTSYKEGYEKSRQSFLKRQQLNQPDAEAGSLRRADLLAGAVLALVVVESATFGAALAGSWLALPDALGGAMPQARLFAAFAAAASLRASTRLPRLLAEAAAVPAVLASIACRPTEERFAFCQERTTQCLAVVAVILLTIRAFNAGLLAGSSGPALAVLTTKLGRLLSPITQLTAVSPVAQAVADAAQAACSALVALGHTVASLDASARTLLPLKPLYAVAELEQRLAAPFAFVCACLRAFYQEVLLTGLRRLGFVTLQTLG